MDIKEGRNSTCPGLWQTGPLAMAPRVTWCIWQKRAAVVVSKQAKSYRVVVEQKALIWMKPVYIRTGCSEEGLLQSTNQHPGWELLVSAGWRRAEKQLGCSQGCGVNWQYQAEAIPSLGPGLKDKDRRSQHCLGGLRKHTLDIPSPDPEQKGSQTSESCVFSCNKRPYFSKPINLHFLFVPSSFWKERKRILFCP